MNDPLNPFCCDRCGDKITDGFPIIVITMRLNEHSGINNVNLCCKCNNELINWLKIRKEDSES